MKNKPIRNDSYLGSYLFEMDTGHLNFSVMFSMNSVTKCLYNRLFEVEFA